jgi:hypothetical protein
MRAPVGWGFKPPSNQVDAPHLHQFASARGCLQPLKCASNRLKIKRLCRVFHSRSNEMRGSSLSTPLTIGIGLAIAFSAAIPRVAFAGQAAETHPAVSSDSQAQFQQTFAQWRDRHGVSGETCLAQPDGAADPGRRWYYHVDAATQRHCWYQKPIGAGPAPAAKTSRAQAADSGHSKKRARAVPITAGERASTLPLTPGERDALFRQFQQWRDQQP